MRALILLLLVSCVRDAVACFAPPVEQNVTPEALIARTKNIVLAEVTRAEMIRGGEVLYTFRRVRTLAGRTDKTIILTGHAAIWEGDNETFNNHFDPSFWEGRGRTPNDTDCRIHASFAVGGTYLLFLDEPYHVKSFELIIRTNGDKETRDKWLQFVERALGPNKSLERTREG
jgi:hypothetical protein